MRKLRLIYKVFPMKTMSFKSDGQVAVVFLGNHTKPRCFLGGSQAFHGGGGPRRTKGGLLPLKQRICKT